MKLDDLTGKTFGRFVVIRRSESTRSGMSRWECKCICGSTRYVAGKHLKSGASKSCGCIQKERTGNLHPQWTGIGEISGDMWNNIVNHSMSRTQVPIEIDKTYAWNLFLDQNKRCSLSGVELNFGNKGYKRTASLDRVDSSKGYVIGNVQWVHKDVNRMKNTFDQNYFIDFCKKIARTHDYL